MGDDADATEVGADSAVNADPTGDAVADGTDQATVTIDSAVPLEVDDEDGGGTSQDAGEAQPERMPRPVAAGGKAVALMVAIVLTLGGLAGWLGLRAHESRQIAQTDELFVQVARQTAINLTTIDAAQADADVQRILDSATGQFYDEFSARSQPFLQVVKQVQSKSEGTVTEAGLESSSADGASVLVAVSVKTSTAQTPEEGARNWRMRLSTQKVGDQVKVSKVEFVP